MVRFQKSGSICIGCVWELYLDVAGSIVQQTVCQKAEPDDSGADERSWRGESV